MRLQTLYLPPVGDNHQYRFALIVDQAERGDDDDEYQEGVERLWEFAKACGASAVLVTPDTVELPETPDVVDEPGPVERVLHTFVPPARDLSAAVAGAVRTYIETRERLARPR